MMGLIRRCFTGLIAWVGVVLSSGCSGDSREVTSDWIDVPATASGQSQGGEDGPVLTFQSLVATFDTVVEGQEIRQSFTFENTGKSPLLLTDVHADCGCTVVRDWPRDPIPPGGRDSLSVVFDTRGKTGDNNKQITVTANTYPAITVLSLQGHVVGPQGAALP
jgi:hypothetical protein